MASNVIVFGPTGNVASIAAITAREQGAKVFLAMRDPKKSISGLSEEAERQGEYQRIQADLTVPDTVSSAVHQSGAKRAFIYVAHGSEDHMRSTAVALKDAGIEFVVFLGSFTVEDPHEVQQDDPIAYVHAQVEISLEEVFGRENFVAIRPGGFVTNSLRWKKGILAGHLQMYGTDFEIDCITPEDMGRVCGNILVRGSEKHAVYLYGPQMASHKEVAKSVARALGNPDLSVEELDPEEATKRMAGAGVPMSIIKWTIHRQGRDNKEPVPRPHHLEGIDNIRRYTGRPAMALDEWAQQNRALFV
ncbi:Hypothetical predicted protein [Lecanosticta acicola]|uniref:NmrA-like domain-containing protein n=1 Tax=Lecanosticta acicola TaxID=111012 RepID=A0AAI8Z8L1_9PEZI|nr:Hypothetical predicted protein [Lecanosticta acicola]